LSFCKAKSGYVAINRSIVSPVQRRYSANTIMTALYARYRTIKKPIPIAISPITPSSSPPL
jgi:hypothetical protein